MCVSNKFKSKTNWQKSVPLIHHVDVKGLTITAKLPWIFVKKNKNENSLISKQTIIVTDNQMQEEGQMADFP